MIYKYLLHFNIHINTKDFPKERFSKAYPGKRICYYYTNNIYIYIYIYILFI